MANLCKITIVLILLACAKSSRAQMSTLVLHNGSKLRGYISVQRPGKDITFHSVEAEMYVKDKDIISISDTTIPFDLLPAGWRRQALRDEALSFDGKKWWLALETVETSSGTHCMVYVKERGMTVRYVQFAEDDYILKWSDIAEISKDDQNEGKEKCYDEVALYNGTVYTGNVIGQSPGKSMKVKERNGGITVIEQSQVKSSRKISSSAGVNLWNVRPYTNILKLNDNSTRNGFIVYQQSGKTPDDSFIDILKENGMQERINFMDIKEYQCIPSDGVYEEYEEGKLYIDEILVQKCIFTSLNGYLYTTDTLSNIMPQGVPIYFKAQGIDALNGWKLLKLKKMSLEKGSVVHGFKVTASDFIPTIAPKERNAETIALLCYGVLAGGYYVLMNQLKTEFYVINIKSRQ